MKEWLTVNETSFYTEKSEATIRRWLSEHKNKKNTIKKIDGKTHIKTSFISEYFTIKNDTHNSSYDNQEHEKQKAGLILEKQNKDLIKDSQSIIKELIQQRKAKSYLPLYITIGFIILFIFLSFISYYLFKEYKLELTNNQKSKIVDISANHQKEVKILKDQLIDTKKTYSVLIKEIKDTNNKLTVNQSNTIDKKEKEIEILQKELNRINSQINTDSEIIN